MHTATFDILASVKKGDIFNLEGFQNSEKGEKATASVESVYDALDIDLDNIICSIETACEQLTRSGGPFKRNPPNRSSGPQPQETNMTYLVTKNVKTQAVTVYTVDQPADLERFYTDESISPEISGWPVEGALDLSKTSLSNKDMLTLYNGAVDKPLTKFQDKQSAIERTLGLFPKIAHPIAELFPKPMAAPKADKPATAKKSNKGVIDLQPPEKRTYPCREGTKQARLVDGLAKGATLAELVEACSDKFGGKAWDEKSVLSGIYWDINKIKGYGARTEFNKDGTPRYYLRYPAGQDAPTPHKMKAKSSPTG